jgi:hypothetical protein
VNDQCLYLLIFLIHGLSIRILTSLLVSQSHGSARCLWQGSSPGFALHTIEL